MRWTRDVHDEPGADTRLRGRVLGRESGATSRYARTEKDGALSCVPSFFAGSCRILQGRFCRSCRFYRVDRVDWVDWVAAGRPILPLICCLSVTFQPLFCASLPLVVLSLFCLLPCSVLPSTCLLLVFSPRVLSSGSLLGFSPQAPSQAPSSQRLSIRARSRGMITSQE